LSDKLDFDFKSNIGTMDYEPFGGHRGNALAAFFSKFTPQYVISALTDYINENNPVMCDLMKMIRKD